MVRAGDVVSARPNSSRRCWLAGITPPQRLQCFELVLTWLWQCGHSIIWREKTECSKHILVAALLRITEGQRSSGHCPSGSWPHWKQFNEKVLVDER